MNESNADKKETVQENPESLAAWKILAQEEKQRGDILEGMIDRMSATLADCAMLVTPLRELCYEIEKCGASEQLTKTVILASEIQRELKYIVDYTPIKDRVAPMTETIIQMRSVSETIE